MQSLTPNYWNQRYQNDETGWDIGYPSPSITAYFENIDKNAKILIPGCGNSYEGEWLYRNGFTNVTLADYAEKSKENFLNRCPDFNPSAFITGDFFDITGTFDVIVEQTFFCALNPNLREAYIHKMNDLLSPKGRLIGLLFNIPLNEDRPPFGGSLEQYQFLFSKQFKNVSMSPCTNSIPPRAGSELWIEILK